MSTPIQKSLSSYGTSHEVSRRDTAAARRHGDRAIAINAKNQAACRRQVALLETFAEQAVIAITSAETYRALDQRTSDLEESLEHRPRRATCSKSSADRPRSPAGVGYARRNCRKACSAEMGVLSQRDGESTAPLQPSHSRPKQVEFARNLKIVPGPGTTAGEQCSNACRSTSPTLPTTPNTLAGRITVLNFRTTLGVPLLREGEPSESSLSPFTR